MSNNSVASLFPKAERETPAIQSTSPELWVGEAQAQPGDLWDLKHLNLTDVWHKFGVRGQNVNVYVIDTGVDFAHPAFLHLASSALGRSFVSGVDHGDERGHGTWVAGKIAGQGVGIAPRCNLFSARVFDSTGTGTTEQINAALTWVLEQPDPHVVNMSLGGMGSNEEQRELIQALKTRGCLVLAAAGNFGSNVEFYPAAYDGCLAIGAYGANKGRAQFSNYGDFVDLSAPGVECYGPYLGGLYRRLQGTSMATPIAAGLATLAYSYCLAKSYTMPREKILDLVWKGLLETAADYGEKGRDQEHGFGSVDGLRLFAYLDRHHAIV